MKGTNEIASSCLLANAFVFGHFSKNPVIANAAKRNVAISILFLIG